MGRSDFQSRRRFFRHLAGACALIPAEYILGLFPSVDQQAAAYTLVRTPKTASEGAENPLGFSFVDVAPQAGLGNAVNIYGGVKTKRYLMDEMGCGAAFSTMIMTVGWIFSW